MADTALQVAARKIDAELVLPLRQQLVSRRIAMANPNVKGDGIYNVDITTINELGSAQIKYELPSDKDTRDSAMATRTNVNIPVIGKNFEIPRQDFEAYRTKGIMFDTAVAQSAMQVAGVQEDTLVIQGWAPDGSTYQISGFYQGAGNDYSNNADFGTYGQALSAVAGGIALAEADYVFPQAWNLLLNPTQANELRASVSTAGFREMTQLMELLNYDRANGPASIISTPTITAGTGLLSPVDPARTFIEYYIPRDMSTQLGEDSKFPETSPIYGATWELIYPHIKQANALVKLSSI